MQATTNEQRYFQNQLLKSIQDFWFMSKQSTFV